MFLYESEPPYAGLARRGEGRGWAFQSSTMGRIVEGFASARVGRVYVALDMDGNYNYEIAVHELAHLWLSVNGYAITQAWLP